MFGNISGVWRILTLKQPDTIKFTFLSRANRNARET